MYEIPNFIKKITNKILLFLILLILIPFLFHTVAFSSEKPALQSSGLSTVVLVDSSGSMKFTDPEFLRGRASKLFIDLLATGDELAIIEFSSDLKVLTPLTLINSSADREKIKKDLEKLTIGKNTRIDLALDKAQEILSKSKYNNKAIILLSDGALDVDGSPSSVKSKEALNTVLNKTVKNLARQKIKTYTISLSDISADANSKKLQEELMTKLAKETKGFYSVTSTPQDLHKKYIDLIKEIMDPPRLYLDKEKDYIDFQVDKTIKRVNIIIDKSRCPSAKITLKNEANEYTSSAPGLMLWTKTSDLELITLFDIPKDGLWKIYSSESVDKLNVEVIADTDYKLTLNPIKGDINAKKNIDISGQMLVKTSNSKPYSIFIDKDLKYFAEIITPKKNKVLVPLDKVMNKANYASYQLGSAGKYLVKLFTKGKFPRQTRQIELNAGGMLTNEPRILLDHNVYALGEKINITIESKDPKTKFAKDCLAIKLPDNTIRQLDYKKFDNKFVSSYQTTPLDKSGQYVITLSYTNVNGNLKQIEFPAYVIGKIDIVTSEIKYGKINNNGGATGFIEVKSELTLTTLPAKLEIAEIQLDQEPDVKNDIKFIYPEEFMIKGANKNINLNLSVSKDLLSRLQNFIGPRTLIGKITVRLKSTSGDTFTEKTIPYSFVNTGLVESNLHLVLPALILLGGLIYLGVFLIKKKRPQKPQEPQKVKEVKSYHLVGNLVLKAFPPKQRIPAQKKWELTGLEQFYIGSDISNHLRLPGLDPRQAVIYLNEVNKTHLIWIKPLSEENKVFINNRKLDADGKQISKDDKINLNGYVFEWEK